jgi:excisionase family DNA binding protein
MTTALMRLPDPPEEGGSRLSALGSRRDGGPAASRSADQRAEHRAPSTEHRERSELPSIGMIRERLPRHMERLLQVPTSEVAQNSYKSPFKETREDLIRRLLDPSLTLEEAARLLGVCPTTVRRYTNKGLLHHYRTVGNQRRFRLSDVLTFLDEHGGTWMLQEIDEEGENEE